VIKKYSVHRNDDGLLIPVDFSSIPFDVSRCFVVAAPNGAVRGKHAHHETLQYIICVSGQLRLSIENNLGKDEVLMLPGDAYFHPNMEWAEIEFLDDSVFLSLCSTEYNEKDYIRDYDEFKEIL